MKRAMTLVVTTMLSLATAAHAIPANKKNFMCGAKGGMRNGECAFHLGCIISEAVGGFDCYQEVPSETPGYWPDDNGFENPFVPEPIEKEVAPKESVVETPTAPAPAPAPVREAVAAPSGGGGGSEGATGGFGTLSGPSFFDSPQGSRGGGYLLGNGSDYNGSQGFGLGVNIDFGAGGGGGPSSGSFVRLMQR
ncbi:MAG: hypothetical protein KDK24_08415 [Pseudooceanicola sp.]|nr:hypothetical protein [Pseudooceanicola sp.]